jgi:hypothetical protein
LDDGRYEQRYQVTANVLFRLVSVIDGASDVRCADESREVMLAEFAGPAGFHAELRIRSADPTALDVSAEPHANTATPASGR